MELTQHCNLCDHHRADFKLGLICGLTQRKPDFSRVCSKSSLNAILKQELIKVHAHHEVLKQSQLKQYLKSGTAFGIAAALLMIGIWLLSKYGTDVRSTLYIALGFIGSATYPLFWAFNDLVNFRQDLTVTQKKIKHIDEVLALYRIRYDIQHTTEEIFYEEYEMTTQVTLHR